MKKTKQLLTASFLLFSISVFAQDPKPGVGTDPFAKGNWSFDLNRIGSYNQTTFYRNDDKLFERTEADLNLQAMYFFTKGFGVGLNYTSTCLGEQQSSTKSYSIGAKLQYGMPIGNNYIYARIGGGLGSDKDVDHIPGSDNDIEEKFDFNNLNAAIGLPIRLQKGGHTYFTPEISWNRDNWELDGGKEVENVFGIGLKLQTYLSPSEFNCGKKIDAATINRRYDRGSQFIDFNSSGFYGLTSNKTTYDAYPVSSEVDVSGVDLMVHYGYYIANNFAVGAGVGLNTSHREQSGNESNTTEWSFIPDLTFNLPAKNCWNNLFLNVEGGVGATTYKSNVAGNAYTFKQHFVSYGGSIGFNYLLSSNIALTPKIGYGVQNFDNSTNDDKIKTRGPQMRFGFRYIF